MAETWHIRVSWIHGCSAVIEIRLP